VVLKTARNLTKAEMPTAKRNRKPYCFYFQYWQQISPLITRFQYSSSFVSTCINFSLDTLCLALIESRLAKFCKLMKTAPSCAFDFLTIKLYLIGTPRWEECGARSVAPAVAGGCRLATRPLLQALLTDCLSASWCADHLSDWAKFY
jgi:hypothetical protein